MKCDKEKSEDHRGRTEKKGDGGSANEDMHLDWGTTALVLRKL